MEKDIDIIVYGATGFTESFVSNTLHLKSDPRNGQLLEEIKTN